jgi:2-dehydropantoate 2-reductase
MKVLLAGAGAVGLGLAGSLITGGAEVHLLGRGFAKRPAENDGIKIRGLFGTFDVSPDQFQVLDYDAEQVSTSYDLTIIATKAYDVLNCLNNLQRCLKQERQIGGVLLVQNGWGIAQETRRSLDKSLPVYSASVITGFEKFEPRGIEITAHADDIKIGCLFEPRRVEVESVVNAFKRGFIPASYDEDIAGTLLNKLMYNLCLNPLGALLGCTYGELASNSFATDLMSKMAAEAVTCIRASLEMGSWKSGDEYVYGELLPNLIPLTAAHRSSMLQDIRSGRKTEIRYINGAIVSLASQKGLQVPVNETIVNLIESLEKSTIMRSKESPDLRGATE